MNRKSHQLYDELSSKENFTQVCEQLNAQVLPINQICCKP